MRSKKSKPKEEGYLLLESLLTIMIVMVILTTLCPLIINWLSQYQENKNLVEQNRLLYEHSIFLNTEPPKWSEDTDYTIGIDKHLMKIKETGTEVVIYESHFKK